MLLSGNTDCLDQFAFDIDIRENGVSTGTAPIINGCGEYTYEISSTGPGRNERRLVSYRCFRSR